MATVFDILNRIDAGDYAMPQFQRGYVWNRVQVRKLMTSLYRGYPIGAILLWEAPAGGVDVKGSGVVKRGTVNLILDGQQRITTLYGVMRGVEPPFFEGDSHAFTGLMFNIDEETFEFNAPKMKGDSAWVSVTDVYRVGAVKKALSVKQAGALDEKAFDTALTRLNRIEQIKQTEILSQVMTGDDKTVDVVVEIFNNVNSGGTKLSKGDLALAKICAAWPAMRDEMQKSLDAFSEKGYSFTRDWLLRCLTVHLAKSAYFSALDGFSVKEIQKAFKETVQLIGTCLDQIAGRLGLDHARVLGSPFSIATMIAVLDYAGGKLSASEWGRLLCWHVHVFLWGRYAGSTESVLAQDINVVKNGEGIDGLFRLIKSVRPDLRLRADDFWGWSTGARFYPLMYLLVRMGHARDWGSGIELNSHLLGKNSTLEIHHIFPKKMLYDAGYTRAMVNQLANYAFLTKDTNLEISDRSPDCYLPGYVGANPGAVESHAVPTNDLTLWRVENYEVFLAKRRELLAAKANEMLSVLCKGENLSELSAASMRTGCVEIHDYEDDALSDFSNWLERQGYEHGVPNFGVSGTSRTEIVDLAWPDGLRAGCGEPVALMVESTSDARSFVTKLGYRVFETSDDVRAFVEKEVRVGERFEGNS